MKYSRMAEVRLTVPAPLPARIFVVYKDKAGAWRWQLIAASNGRITGGSAESFASRANAVRAAVRESSFYVQEKVAVALMDR